MNLGDVDTISQIWVSCEPWRCGYNMTDWVSCEPWRCGYNITDLGKL